MARSINDIYQSILAAKDGEAVLAALNSPSQVAIWRLMVYVVAVAMWSLELLFDWHVAEVDETIAAGKAHSVEWYAGMALKYQHGRALALGKDFYDNAGVPDATVAAEKVVKYSAADETDRKMRIKAAREVSGELTALTTPQLEGLTAYMKRVRDGGVKLNVTSGAPDSLKLSYIIYYDALVLGASGARLDGTAATPVQDAIAAQLKDLPFNGVFVTAQLTDRLQAVPGVVIPHLVSAQARYGLLAYQPVTVEYKPDAGYLRIINPSDLTLQFIPREPL